MHLPRIVLAALLVAASGLPAAAAQAVTQADVARLQDAVFEAGTDVSSLRTGDAILLRDLRAELNELREDVIYFKVKLRKGEAVARAEIATTRDRIEEVRRRARGEHTATAADAPPGGVGADPNAARQGGVNIPARTEIAVRLLTRLDSATAYVDDRLEAATAADLVVNGRVVVPAGSLLRGVVTAVEPLSRTNRMGTMTVGFDFLTVNYRAYPIRATVVPGGGTIAAAEGRNVERTPGALLRVRFEAPVTIFVR